MLKLVHNAEAETEDRHNIEKGVYLTLCSQLCKISQILQIPVWTKAAVMSLGYVISNRGSGV